MAWAIPIAKAVGTAWLGSKAASAAAGKPPTPPAPIDGAATAQANTQINRPDQVTPYGTLKWSQSSTDPNDWTSTMELNPELQGMLESSWKNASTSFDKPITTPLGVDMDHAYRNAEGNFNNFDDQVAGAGALAVRGREGTTQGLDKLSELLKVGGPKANEEARKAIEDSLYARSTARLDPRFAQSGDQLNTALANQGITQGSEAYNREQQNFGMTKNDAYSSAMNDAVTGSTNEMAKLFGMELAGREQDASIAERLGNLGGRATAAGLDWQKASDAQQGLVDNAALQRIGVISAQNQDQFQNELASRDQTLQELNGVRSGIDPGFMGQGNDSSLLDAMIAQQSGQTANYNVNAAGYNAEKAATAQMVQQAMQEYWAKKQAEDAAKAAGNV